MAKIIPLHNDDILFLDVLPKINPELINRIKKQLQNKKK